MVRVLRVIRTTIRVPVTVLEAVGREQHKHSFMLFGKLLVTLRSFEDYYTPQLCCFNKSLKGTSIVKYCNSHNYQNPYKNGAILGHSLPKPYVDYTGRWGIHEAFLHKL